MSVKLKNSNIQDKIPLLTDLVLGELAINTFDGFIYLKTDQTGLQNIITIKPITKQNIESVLTGVISSHSHADSANSVTAYNHSQAAHAPSTAQKNSDITKAEIEAKLTGEISTHSHAGGGSVTKEAVEAVLTGEISSHTHAGGGSVTKESVESVLTGEIISHTHNNAIIAMAAAMAIALG